MPAGSKPGEHRGGRVKGQPNKATIEKALAAEKALEQAKASGIPLARNVLQEYMMLFRNLSREAEPQSDIFWRCAKHAIECAKELAQYESAKMRSIVVSGDPDKPIEFVNRIERVIVPVPKVIEHQ